MITIERARVADSKIIVDIGLISVEEAHRGSCAPEELNEYLEKHYNTRVIGEELSDENNIYHIIRADGEPAGFSRVMLNSAHSAIEQHHVTKLDRIYLLSKFFSRGLGRSFYNSILTWLRQTASAVYGCTPGQAIPEQ